MFKKKKEREFKDKDYFINWIWNEISFVEMQELILAVFEIMPRLRNMIDKIKTLEDKDEENKKIFKEFGLELKSSSEKLLKAMELLVEKKLK